MSIPRLRLLGGLAGVAAAPYLASGGAAAAQFQFKCGGFFTVDHPMSVRSKQMWEAIGRESGGRIDAQFFPNFQLGNDVAQFALLRAGGIQFYHCPPSIAGGYVPAGNITDVAFAFNDVGEALRVLDGPLGEYIDKEYEAKGLHPLPRVWDSGMRQLINNKRPIHRAEDVEGLRVRTAESKIVVDFFKELKASPTPLPFAEMYTASQTHLVDGAELALATIQSARLFEVQKYLSLTNDSWSCFRWLANGDTWKSLPSDLQSLIERNHAKYALLGRADSRILTAALVDKLSREGMLVNQGNSASFRERLGNYYTYWKGAFGATEWGLLQGSIKGKLV